MLRHILVSSIVGLFLSIAWSPQARSMDLIFKDPQYSFQMLRAISATAGGAADIGECLATAARITEGDDESWYAAWVATAQRREQTGDEFLRQGHRLSAGKEFLRASNYYRTAEFFLRSKPGDPRILETWRKSRDAFLKYADLALHPILPANIPFEGKTLPGYLCLVDGTGKQRPLLIVQTGFDGTKEELYYSQAVFALERDYNVLLFEGPGQGQVIREQGIPFRHNWETVVTPVVDFALTRQEVDPDRIALMGISFGGYLAPRAAAFEHRLKALIANGGVYDFHSTAIGGHPEAEDALDDPASSAEMDAYILQAMEQDPSLRWAMSNAMFTFKAASPSDWMRMTRPYVMKDVAGSITARTLIVDSEGDRDMPGQAKKLYDAIVAPKDYMLFTAQDGAEEHCQVGAMVYSNSRILNWLDEVMRKQDGP
jgi:pimeloyl-ACP methyl ester carboxylesterase